MSNYQKVSLDVSILITFITHNILVEYQWIYRYRKVKTKYTVTRELKPVYVIDITIVSILRM